MDNLLAEGIRRLDLHASETQIELLNRYLDEIERWNRRMNLVRANREELIVRHVLDSLAGLPHILRLKNRGTCADIGSGAGLPGIPLSLFMPDSNFALVERSGKRAQFLRSCSALLNLRNVTIIECNLRELKDIFEVVIFRAFTKLNDRRMSFIERITCPTGTIVAYKGRYNQILKEVGGKEQRYEDLRIVPLEVPFLRAERHLLLIGGGK